MNSTLFFFASLEDVATTKIRFINSLKAPFKRYIKTGSSLYRKRNSLHGSQVTMPSEIDDAAAAPQDLRSALRERAKCEAAKDAVYENAYQEEDEDQEENSGDEEVKYSIFHNSFTNNPSDSSIVSGNSNNLNNMDNDSTSSNLSNFTRKEVTSSGCFDPAPVADRVDGPDGSGSTGIDAPGFVEWDDVNDPDYIPLPGENDKNNCQQGSSLKSIK